MGHFVEATSASYRPLVRAVHPDKLQCSINVSTVTRRNEVKQQLHIVFRDLNTRDRTKLADIHIPVEGAKSLAELLEFARNYLLRTFDPLNKSFETGVFSDGGMNAS